MKIDRTDLYQLLVAAVRYATMRNNHLEPSHTFSQVRKYLARMLQSNSASAVHTAHQIADEVINRFCNLFPKQEDLYNHYELYKNFIVDMLQIVVDYRDSLEDRNYYYSMDNLRAFTSTLTRCGDTDVPKVIENFIKYHI